MCWAIVGDLVFFGNDLGYPHFGANHFCWFCSASREKGTEFPFTDLSLQARWRETLLSDDECISVPCTDNVIKDLKGVTRFHSPGDLMHTSDMGVVSVFCRVHPLGVGF